MSVTESHRSEFFAFADQFVSELAAIDPLFATDIGDFQYDHLLPDLSPGYTAPLAQLVRSSIATARQIEPIDEIDRIAQSVMLERLAVQLDLLDSGERVRTFGVLWSALSSIQQTFELMPAETPAHAEVIRQRLAAIPAALSSWRGTLMELRDRGELPARRHVDGVAGRAETIGHGGFVDFARRTAELTGVDPEGSGLVSAATDADAACGELAAWIRSEILEHAADNDRSSIERYKMWFRYFNGVELEDPNALYEWGWGELKRIRARMWELAAQIAPDARTMTEVAAVLDADESRILHGTDELLAKLESFTKEAVAQLNGVHFDIDPRIQRCDARLAPEGSAAAAYYEGPSEDLSRPGTTWFPTMGETTFPWWRSASTWYHEAVPGHHLQVATSLIQSERLSRYQRLAGWTSGYGEGWALYAERLMDELGGFADPGDELGHLAGQALRAARVVVDLGMHLGLAAPSDIGVLGDLGDCAGRTWTPEMAVALLEEYALETHDYSVSEVDRYLSMPAQSTSYKVGEKVWLEVRADARQRLGERFDLKRFHAYALNIGPMGLDTFRSLVSAWDGQ